MESELGAVCFLEVKAPCIHQKRENLRMSLGSVNELLRQEAQSEYLQRVGVPGVAPPAGLKEEAQISVQKFQEEEVEEPILCGAIGMDCEIEVEGGTGKVENAKM